MSLILRTLLRDPLVTRPLSRAMRRRYDDNFWNDGWLRPSKRLSAYESPDVMVEDMNRQMALALDRMHEFAEEIDSLERLTERFDRDHQPKSLKRKLMEDAMVKRTEDGGLQLALDVKDFKPEDLKIKLVDDNLVIEATTETSGKDSFRRNHLKRWFKLPEDCKVDEIRSKLTQDHHLVIDLPSNKPIENSRSRPIPIEVEKASQSSEKPKGEQASKEGQSNESNN